MSLSELKHTEYLTSESEFMVQMEKIKISKKLK
jgi:hypothetical protein